MCGLFFFVKKDIRGSNYLNARVRWTLAWRVGSRQLHIICPSDKLATSLVTRSIKKDHTNVWSSFLLKVKKFKKKENRALQNTKYLL